MARQQGTRVRPAIDGRTGRVEGILEFQTAVEEILDGQLVPGVHFPEVVGFEKEDVLHAFVVPPGLPRA